MSAKFSKEVSNLVKFLKHIIAFDTSSRALETFLTVGKYDGRSVVFLLDPAGDNSGQTLMNIGDIYDKYLILLQSLCINNLKRTVNSLFGHSLTHIIQSLKLSCLNNCIFIASAP